MSEPLPPRLDPSSIETPLYQEWLEAGRFHVSASEVLEEGKEPHVIVIPPPNVTAVLHMGHGLNNTIQDVLTRWRRMQARAALWVPGTDHAGIATQNVVERLIAEEGKTRDDLGREAFLDRMWSFVEETGGTILDQLKAIGSSCDWERTRFTLDPGLSRAVREVFVRLYEKDLVYRGKYIINWCPRCLTALANEEAEGEETEGRLWHIRYPLVESAWGGAEDAARAGAEAIGQLDDGRWYLTVSTTRPETMLGDTAIAVHPDDERYHSLVGGEAQVPLTGRTVPIVADTYVDPEFGSGMVKVTPAHDPNDFEIAKRTGVPPLEVMTERAEMNENAPERFRGMDRFTARKEVVKALADEGLLAGEEAHRHSVPRCYRCDTVVEPRLSTQWFVRMEPLAKPALDASRDGTITFTPVRWKKVYEQWLENIRDWCISRQLWWGHRIPVWYCDACGETIVAREDPDACPKCASTELRQDPDVLDTWFSSWLWPFSVFGWPEETDDLKAFYPTQTMVTAPEILFFWVARMIMSGYEFMGEAPFTEVYLHGTVRDAKGRKMSKSLGNGIDPIEVVDRFGADALRWTLVSLCGVGTDIHLDHEDLEASFSPGRNFANKVWNAGRFTLMSLGDGPVRPLAEVWGDDTLTFEDHWILARLTETSKRVDDQLKSFRLHEVAETLHHFFWGDFADWYLELVKPRLREDADAASREAARTTLVIAFDGVLRLLHPVIPFVTEALWRRLPWPEGEQRPEALIVASWPTPLPPHDPRVAGPIRRAGPDAIDQEFSKFRELVATIRSLRKEYGVGEGQEVEVWVRIGSAPMNSAWIHLSDQLPRLAKARPNRAPQEDGDLRVASGRQVGAQAVLPDGTEIFLPLEGVIDIPRERERLAGEAEDVRRQLTGTRAKLDNEQFVTKAPAEVVEREREKAAALEEQLDKLDKKVQELVESREVP